LGTFFSRVSPDTVRAVKEREPPVRVFVDTHRRAHEVRPQRVRRDLQDRSAPLDGVVVADPALLLDAQDLAPLPIRRSRQRRNVRSEIPSIPAASC
jgi:hypothetical protein